MNFTAGEMMFYGGAAGAVIVIILSIIILSVLARGRSRLRRKFEKETLKNHK
ncbi:MAG: hypothetical protein ACI4J4_00230 [Ruminiclostridium sp.]